MFKFAEQLRQSFASDKPKTTTEQQYGTAKYWHNAILRMYHIGLSATDWRPDLELSASQHLDIQKEAQTYYTDAKLGMKQTLLGEDISDLETEAFIMAVLLFTYGRLDVVQDILNYDPDPRVNLRELRKCFWCLMPQDELKNVWNDRQKALAWFEANKHHLYWEPEQERYYQHDIHAEYSELAEAGMSDFLSNLEDYEEQLARGEIKWLW